MEPGLEAVGSRSAERPPGGDERLLGRVLGPSVVVEDQAGGAKSRPIETRARSVNAS